MLSIFESETVVRTPALPRADEKSANAAELTKKEKHKISKQPEPKRPLPGVLLETKQTPSRPTRKTPRTHHRPAPANHPWRSNLVLPGSPYREDTK
jgi:hypothetical protein